MDVRQNAGRCDWCGKPVDMSSGDKLVIAAEDDFGVPEFGVTAEEAAGSIADALESVGGPKDEMLAETIREDVGYRLHGRCYDESSFDKLTVDADGWDED